MSETIPAGVFKAKCLEIMDEVARTRDAVVVTKHGRPVVRVLPAAEEPRKPIFGRLRDSVTLVAEDAFAPEPEIWGAFVD